MSHAQSSTFDPSMSQIEDWSAAVTGGLLMLFGMSRRSWPGLCLALAGTPLVYRGVTGAWPDALLAHPDDTGHTRAALGADRGVHVREAVRLEKPIAEVFDFWRKLENLPRFMQHLESVTDHGEGRSTWIARGPAGLRVEWNAEIINEVPNQVIGWRSTEGADIVTAGSVNFDMVRNGTSTQVTVHLQYEPPAGRAGDLIATLFGRAPSQTIREDLRRLKQILEAGELAQVTQETAR